MIRTWDSNVDGAGPFSEDGTVDLRDLLPEAGQFLLLFTLKRGSPGVGLVQLTAFWRRQGDETQMSINGPNLDLAQDRESQNLTLAIRKAARDVEQRSEFTFGWTRPLEEGQEPSGSWGFELLIIGAGP